MAHNVPARLSASEGRRFAGTVGGAFLLIGAISFWRGHARVGPTLAAVGAVFLLAGLLVPTHLRPIQRTWMGFGVLLSRITAPLFMGVVYFVVLTPAGLVRRALGKNSLVPRRDRTGSYWVSRADSPPSPLTRQF